MLLPVFHTGHSRDSDRAERCASPLGSWPSLSGPSPSSLWHCERGQTPSPRTHTGTAGRCGHNEKRTIKAVQTKLIHLVQFKEGNFYCKIPSQDTSHLHCIHMSHRRLRYPGLCYASHVLQMKWWAFRMCEESIDRIKSCKDLFF